MGGRVKKGRFLRKYIGLISIAFILALSAVGIGYGAWNDGLQTEVTVKTGDFDLVVEITKVEYRTAILGRWKTHYDWYMISPSNNDEVNVVLDNTTPEKDYYIYFKVKNEGTIPIHYVLAECISEDDAEVKWNDSKPRYIPKILNVNDDDEDNYIRVERTFGHKDGEFKVRLKVKQWNL